MIKSLNVCLKHIIRPLPAPTIADMLNIRGSVSLPPLIEVRTPFNAKIEADYNEISIKFPDDRSELFFYSENTHEHAHACALSSDSGISLYLELEKMISKAIKGERVNLPGVDRYLRVYYEAWACSLQEYVIGAGEHWRKRYEETGYAKYLKFSRVADSLNVRMYEEVINSIEEYRPVYRLLKSCYSAFRGRMSYLSYLYEMKLISQLCVFSKLSFYEVLKRRLKVLDADLSKIDLEYFGIRIPSLKSLRLHGFARDQRDRIKFVRRFLLRLGKSENLLDFLRRLIFEFKPPIIICDGNSNRYVIYYDLTNENGYVWKRRFESEILLGFYVDLSIALQMRDKRETVVCPLSGSPQFRRCSKCLGLLFPYVEVRPCRFVRKWKSLTF